MKLNKLIPSVCVSCLLCLLAMDVLPQRAVAQNDEPLFDLPVQLIGFPVIIMTVRLSNFFKKLAYSLNPETYRSRNRRAALGLLDGEPANGEFSSRALNVLVAEKQILQEFGPKVCILEEPCKFHAHRPAAKGEQPDWDDILSNYKSQSGGMKEWYLLSVFLGDVIRDANLCKQLAKRLPCGPAGEGEAGVGDVGQEEDQPWRRSAFVYSRDE